MGNIMPTKQLTIEAKIENLDTVQEFVLNELENYGCPAKIQMQIAIVIEEIFVNIASYAYTQELVIMNGYSLCTVTIRLSLGNEIVIEFEDTGNKFNPLDKEDPDITLDATRRKIGGMGIFLVKNMVDIVKYRYEDNKNILRIEKSVV